MRGDQNVSTKIVARMAIKITFPISKNILTVGGQVNVKQKLSNIEPKRSGENAETNKLTY